MVESSINGDSNSDILKDLALNIASGTIANAGAKSIGIAYHTDKISKSEQLTLHAILGCAVGATGGGDCASGAVSGVMGELTGTALRDSVYGQNPTLTKEQASQLAGLVGGTSAIITGNAIGLSDFEIADNVYSGQRIGDNAARNNALYIGGKVKIPFSDYITGEGNDYDIHSGLKADLIVRSYTAGTDGKSKSKTFFSLGAGGYINIVPHDSKTLLGLSYNRVPGILFFDAMQTDRGVGFGITLGAFATPSVKAGATINDTKE